MTVRTEEHRAGERIEVAWREIECDVAAQESRDAA